MVKTLLYLLCPLLVYSAEAQNTKTAIIKVDTSINAETFGIPYSQIKVLDARFDHTKIGCCYNSVFFNRIPIEKFDAKFPESFTDYFPKFLNTFIKLEPSSKDQLIILMKQFRIADHLLRGIETDQLEVELTLRMSASFYALHDDRCFKLFSVDNLLLHHIEKLHERKRKYEEGSRSFALRTMLYKLLNTQDWDVNTQEQSFTLPEMQTAIQKRFELPIYNATFKKGIYKDFSAFKNNNPSPEDFTVIYKDGKIHHLEDKYGKPYQPKEIWGICDGFKNYIQIREEFSELVPNDKSFRVLTYATLSEFAGASGNYDLTSGTLGRLKSGLKAEQYFDLDMETGRLYLQEVFGKSSIGLQ